MSLLQVFILKLMALLRSPPLPRLPPLLLRACLSLLSPRQRPGGDPIEAGNSCGRQILQDRQQYSAATACWWKLCAAVSKAALKQTVHCS
jgi:hypothetical protein